MTNCQATGAPPAPVWGGIEVRANEIVTAGRAIWCMR
jgi:hypothetical protein